jgi:predicted enzyme related to lactoylglutathione lyase
MAGSVAGSHGCFVWYELTTTAPEAAKAFYAKVVGWGTQDASAPGAAYTLFTAGEDAIGGLLALPEQARRMGALPRWTGYVGVDDVDAAVSKLKRLGGTVHVPPTDVADISRFAIVADPQMATLALFKWRGGGDDEPPERPAPRCVGWHELFATDWQKAFAFYSELFGWQKVEPEIGKRGTYQPFAVAGRTIGGMATKPAAVPAPFWLFYFNVDDIDAAVERVNAGGGRILEGPSQVRDGTWTVRCADPQDAMFALTGTRSDKSVGYFEPAAASDPGATRFFVPKKGPSRP